MNKNILETYYQGIFSQLEGEVDFINEIITHPGLKGEGNEAAIRNLISKFIPKKYGVGSGIIIDKNGAHSNQCDIIIFDNQIYPEILSFTSTHIYPVDFVYAVIEVKTTLDSKSSKEAIDNIKSVRKLDIIKKTWAQFYSIDESDQNNKKLLFSNLTSEAPYGIIYGHRSDINTFRAFRDRFTPINGEKKELWPTHIFCSDLGYLYHPADDTDRQHTIYPVFNGLEIVKVPLNQCTKKNDKKRNWALYENKSFPTINIKRNEYILLDQSSFLVHFLIDLSEALSRKHLNPMINFRKEYFKDDILKSIGVSNDCIHYDLIKYQ